MQKFSFKRFTAWMLALAIVISTIPVNAFAADDGIEIASETADKDYLFIATDRHTNTSVIGNIINNMESYIGENELDYLALGGDMVGSGNNHPAYNSSTVLGEVTGATSSLSNVNVDIVAGVHDMNVTDDAGIVLPYQGGGAQIYEGDRFYVYGVEEYCISEDSNESNWSSEAQKFVTWANGSEIDKSKVIVVVSHYPLHAKRDDNDGAYYWHQALNTVATGAASGDTTVERNVVFFHGHNHTKDSNEYVYNVGDSMTIQNGSSTTSATIHYTYATAGYLNQNSKATLMAITADSITLTKYSTSGSGTAMTSIERVVAAPTLTSIDVSGDTEYTLGETLKLTVTATYSDGTTADVTADADFEPAALTASGTYTVTASYGGKTAAADVKVYIYDEDENNLIGVEVFSQGATALEVTWDDAAKAVLNEKDLYTDYVVYDLALTNPGESTEYAMTLVDGMDTSNLAVYHVADDGTLTLVQHTIDNDCVVFTTELKGTFAYGSVKVPEGYTLDSIAVSNVVQTDYFEGDNLDMVNPVVTATYTKEGAEDFIRTLYVYEENNNHDGYVVNMDSFNMTAAGSYDVEITYGGKSATFPIHVWGDEFTDDSGVTVELNGAGEEYGVTAATVAVSGNENVAGAVADVLAEGTYVAYDISLTFAEGYESKNAEKTVTLPIPAGVTKPGVYYVSDDGETVTNMGAADNGDGTVTFTTTHFSTYVVGESTEITVPDSETATGSNTTGEKKTVYVPTSSISAGNDYLIVNGNSAGNYYALANNSGSVAATDVTVKTDSEIGTYIELDDAADELWTVSGSNSITLKNGSYYLTYSGSKGNYSLDLSTSSSSWTYSSSRLSIVPNRTTYYLVYDSGWNMSSSGDNVYFYVPTEIDTTTTVSGTYSIVGNPAEETKVVTAGATATLGSTLTFTPESGATTTTDTSATATYTVVDGGDPKDVISVINGNIVTFTGNYGKALVKVSYTTDFGEVTNYITVTATEPTYVLDITSGGNVVTGTTVSVKNVTDGQTLQLGTQIQFVNEDGAEIVELPEGATIEWHIPEEYHSIATVNHDTGLVTLKGVDGAFYVTATLTVGSKDYTVGVNFSVSTSQYSNPTDGAEDFPEYPNEGAIRYDKTATAVGNFSETGIAQVELSMTGVPYTTDSEIDVVVMLDMTGSMSDDGMEAAELATIAFMEKIVKNEDGSYNENRIAVYAFNSGSSSPYELVSLKKITSDSELATATTAIKTASDKQASGGTPFDEAAAKCQSVLSAAKTDGTGNNRQQFCVFMSDGGPTSYEGSDGYTYYGGNNSSGDRAITSYIGGYTSSTSSSWTYNLPTEYYTDAMKAAGVTVYTVGLLLQTAPSSPAPYSSMTDSAYDSTTDTLTSIGSHYYFTSTILKNMASDESKYIDIFNVDNADKATAAFESIAVSILQAATDITVEDKITDEYTMIFDIPEGSKDITGVTNDFYIEFLKYTLDANHERTDSGTSVTKLYLKNTNGELSAAKDSSGTAYDAPVFEQKTIGDKGTLYYWSTNASDGDTGISVEVDGTTYYFVSYGMESGYNMTSGAYAYGTVDSTTNMSADLVIATPYFVYNASTRMLYWTVDKLDTTEYALRYFLYLDDSATEVGTDKEVDPGSYQTNDHAYITYTNFKGNDCRQTFPVPQLTWNGAQVSYVFYLVNAAGQPINKSGQVVDFANATFITDVYTHAVVWNGDNAVEELNIDYLADELLPDDYLVYDESAKYTIHVYQTVEGKTIFDYFIIEGSEENTVNANNGNTVVSDDTTKVYNTKAGTKYSEYGTYSAEAVGTSFTTTDADGNTVTITTTKQASLDYSDTTVAFAVVWQPRLVEDVVVVDYGLDVVINVVQNDILQNKVTGIGVGKDAYGDIAMNIGVSTESELGTAPLTIDGNTISIENETSIRFKQGDMVFDAPVVFYYESPVEFWEGSDPTEGYMYSSVTVIPATTIYYEESFLTFTNTDGNKWTSASAQTGNGYWEEVGTADSSATQSQDRPGESQISGSIDADNVYGYDPAYDNYTTYSLGSAMKVTVDANLITGDQSAPTASFTFKGRGFDIISLTNSDSGAIFMDIYRGKTASDEAKVAGYFVDNYYGYTYSETDGWQPGETVDEGEYPYQVPVMKVEGLEYGEYTVVIRVAFSNYFEHGGSDANSYSFWMDAVRIYDPANNGETVIDEYLADNEAYPVYNEIGDMLIAAEELDVTNTYGAVFIDGRAEVVSVADYENPGPNNEVYLAKGQGIAFQLVATRKPTSTQIGAKLAYGDSASLLYNSVATDNSIANTETLELATATDMYYAVELEWTEIENVGYVSDIVVLSNDSAEGDAVLSLTNIKTTFVANDAEVGAYIAGGAAEAGMFVMTRLYAAPEVFVPETFETKVTRSLFGSYETLTVTTSADVESITVNGEELTSYTTYRGNRIWTKTVKAASAGTYEIVAYNADGLASEIATAAYGATGTGLGDALQSIWNGLDSLFGVSDILKAESAEELADAMYSVMEKLAARVFKPESFQVEFNRTALGEEMLVVNTSEDVDYIISDGEIVNNYITETIIDLSNDGAETVNRVWLVPNADETAEVAAYNAEGVASEAASAVSE